jgi:hypothetical protein
MMGFEPMTSSLPRKCSTTELHRLVPAPCGGGCGLHHLRAGDEARTRDLQLGRLSLYQLSYSRSCNRSGGERRIRTSEVVRQQIYSLPHLATLVFPHWKDPVAGATSRDRTNDLLITSQLLYQLSYGGVKM